MPGFVHIVDADATFRTAVERRLKHAGYEVATYGSAVQLLDRLPSDEAIERAIAHHEVTRGLNSKLDIIRAHVAALTPREREVFELVIRGNTNKQVARELGCTERTFKAHRHRVMEKMQVRTLPELVSLAERVGVLVSDTRQF